MISYAMPHKSSDLHFEVHFIITFVIVFLLSIAVSILDITKFVNGNLWATPEEITIDIFITMMCITELLSHALTSQKNLFTSKIHVLDMFGITLSIVAIAIKMFQREKTVANEAEDVLDSGCKFVRVLRLPIFVALLLELYQEMKNQLYSDIEDDEHIL